MGSTIALATKYAVSAQDASLTLAERLPAMCGRDTFTTVVSRTSIKVPNITAMAMIHGLICGCVDPDGAMGSTSIILRDAFDTQKSHGGRTSRGGSVSHVYCREVG